MPTLQTTASSVEVSTQTSFCEVEEVECTEPRIETATELVVTCHPIDDSSTSDILSERMQNENSNVTAKNLLHKIPSINEDICELEPMLVIDDKHTNRSKTVEIDSEIGVQGNMGDAEGDNIELHCEECDQLFKSSGNLERHLQSHNGFCNMCNQVFNCVQTLQDHCRSVHEGVGCFMCNICEKRFMTKFSYTRHVESHGGKKGAVCHVCGKSFSRADYLQTHYTIHAGKRSFACSQCPKKFVRRIQLASHEKTHTGIKDHVCKMCNRGFARSDKLKEHMLRHLNIKRYQCATCKRFYAEKRDLKTHLKVHMKI